MCRDYIPESLLGIWDSPLRNESYGLSVRRRFQVRVLAAEHNKLNGSHMCEPFNLSLSCKLWQISQEWYPILSSLSWESNMNRWTFSKIRDEIIKIDLEMDALRTRRDGLRNQLQKRCGHPTNQHSNRGNSEVCGKCGKILRSWPQRIGNPI